MHTRAPSHAHPRTLHLNVATTRLRAYHMSSHNAKRSLRDSSRRGALMSRFGNRLGGLVGETTSPEAGWSLEAIVTPPKASSLLPALSWAHYPRGPMRSCGHRAPRPGGNQWPTISYTNHQPANCLPFLCQPKCQKRIHSIVTPWSQIRPKKPLHAPGNSCVAREGNQNPKKCPRHDAKPHR